MGPYSMDPRERVAAAIDEGEGSERQIAKRFRVSVSFVTRLLQRRRDAGTLAPKPHGGGPRPVLGFPEQVRLAMRIAEHPDATLKQLKKWGGFACTLTTLWRTLRRFRLTYKKKTLHAGSGTTPEVQAKRRRYRAKVRRIEAKRLVFVDETGVNTAMTPTHAWARRGERVEGSVPYHVGFDDGDRGPGSGWGAGAAGLPRCHRHAGVPDLCRCRCWHRNSARGTWWSSTTSNPTSLRTWRSRSSVQVPASCPCRHTVRTTTRSRSCGRSSKGHFVGSRRGCERTCTMLLVRPWTM